VKLFLKFCVVLFTFKHVILPAQISRLQIIFKLFPFKWKIMWT